MLSRSAIYEHEKQHEHIFLTKFSRLRTLDRLPTRFQIKVLHMLHTHSSWSDLRMAGILVADGGFGFVTGVAIKKKCIFNLVNINISLKLLQLEALQRCQIRKNIEPKHIQYLLLISTIISSANGSPVIGSVPCSAKYLSINRFSNTCFDTNDNTGCSGTSPLTEIGSNGLVNMNNKMRQDHNNNNIL